MRLMVGQSRGGQVVYAVDGDRAINLTSQDASIGPDLMALVTNAEDAHDRVQKLVDAAPGSEALAEIIPAMPLGAPGKIICLGLNYVDHAKEGGYEIPDYPALFMRCRTSMIAAEAPVVRPSCSERLDYEAELMLIIGKGGRHIAKADAFDHVFGYTLFNDVSVRDYQRKTHQWTPGKNFDRTGPVGPVVVTPDELPAGAKELNIQSRLNGEIMQNANTSDMIFPVDQTIATLSEVMTLEPGDMIAMGTPPGVGHARRPPVWMKAGDVVEIEIEKIGILRNLIVDEG